MADSGPFLAGLGISFKNDLPFLVYLVAERVTRFFVGLEALLNGLAVHGHFNLAEPPPPGRLFDCQAHASPPNEHGLSALDNTTASGHVPARTPGCWPATP